MKYLLVGGSAAGERILMIKRLRYITMPVLPELKIENLSIEIDIKNTTFEHITYERMEFRGNTATYYVYAPVGMLADEVLFNLIKGYTKPTCKGEDE